MFLREFLRISQHRTVLCYLLLSLWIFLLIAGMQRYITCNWVQTNVNLNTRIYVMAPAAAAVPGRGIVAKLSSQIEKETTRQSSLERRICNPRSEVKQGQEGGVLPGWTLKGIIAIIRHGDRGPMVHVREAESVDCGVPLNEYPLLDAYKTFLLNNTLNASLNHMTYMKMGSFHGFPLLPSWSKCQLAQLTPRGIAQHLQIGQILRTAYGLPLGLTQPDRSHYSNDASASGPNIPNTPTHGIENNIIVFSTRYRRTFQSAMALLYGLLPVDKWLGMNVRDSHSLTFCFSDCACPKGDQLKGTVNALLEKEQQQVKTLVKFMEERLLQSPGNNYHALGIRDALLTFLCHDRKVPCEKDAKSGGEGNAENKRAKSDAITSELDIINIDQDSNGIGIGVVEGLAQSSVGEDKSEADDANDDGNGDIISAFTDNGKCIQDQHIDQLMEFTDSLLLKIRHSPDMRLISLLRAYGFLRNAVNYMLKMISGSNIKMVLYSGHDLTIQYLLSAMGLNGKEFIDIPYATRLIFEVYRSENDGQFYFRVVYNGEDVTRLVMVCEGAKSLRFTRGGGGGGNARKASVVDLCPIENIIRYIHDDYFSPLNASNFKDACFAAKY